ncbi:heavy metal-associated isoprenylated plant protein 20-like [Phalaenopsis equestris]|uniref:heavy metal-associated isoprenylated plant protein 20-like n=1 Tax=Phalaenopsis equestris TaxID=78828 RepID=UPI0009E5DCCE|nr:heavy metal-associated isoprenylated plant protein 20-like [Phalaenopsis equestris]
MGLLDHLSEVCSITDTRRALERKKRKRPLQTVQIKVKMDCDGCERRVKHAVRSMKNVISVDVNRNQGRVSVTGHVEPAKVLQRVRSTGKVAEFWPYAPHNLVFYPYVAGAYDKKAPSGFVRKVPQAMLSPGSSVERYISIFSDDNPNACSMM